jgi:regulator of cell morphogenesis and NO signaling
MKKIIRFGKNTKLANVIHSDYTLIPVITRFGIGFGFGDDTIAQICQKYNINLHFFLEILSAFHDPEYESGKGFSDFSQKQIIDYLLESHTYYKESKIPVIENLLNKLQWSDNDKDKNKAVLKNFFEEYKREVIDHTGHEEKDVFPYILELEQAVKNKSASQKLLDKIARYPIDSYKDDHSELDTALLDLKNLIIKFLPSPINQSVANRLLIEIFNLERDLQDHARLEENILVPKVRAMEEYLLKLS